MNHPGGNVGIGTVNPGTRLTVRGPDTSGSTIAFRVEDSDGNFGLHVFGDRSVAIGTLASSSATHACLTGSLRFAACTSAAEYVPTLDRGNGAPGLGDLVSLLPRATNPAADAHAPFVVSKSTTACDPNLLGYITDPEKGADGPKLTEHYLPLAIYGYFPARVTMEGGAIRRGDPSTSSSTPGAGMRATGACKTVGYALEDATEDGTVQVFANLGEPTAAEVNALRAAMQEKDHRIAVLEQQNATLEARLTALEQRLSTGTVQLMAAR